MTESAKPGAGSLERRVALVTGAGAGLGGAIAETLARAGASVVVCDIDDGALAATRARIEARGGTVYALRCNVADSTAVAAMFEQAERHFGRIDILVNNAARVPARAQDEVRRSHHYAYLTTPVPRTSLGFTSAMSDDEWLRWWDVNVHGVFYCTREALRRMERQRYGRIVNVASIAGYTALSAHSPHYSATKGAVIAFTKSVAAEVAGAGILVNALAPGGVQTPGFDAYLATLSQAQRDQLWQLVPAGRLGTMEEYAATVLHLCGDHYLVGQVVSPNGDIAI